MPGDDPPTASAAVVLLLGYPAAGKRTVGGHVARLLDGVLVDNQLINRPVLEVLRWDGVEPLPPGTWDRVAPIRAAVLDAVEHLAPRTRSVVLTNVLEDDDHGAAEYDRLRALAGRRGSVFLAVLLTCDVDVQVSRTDTPDRVALRKGSDPEGYRRFRETVRLHRPPADEVLHLDTTTTPPEENARLVVEELRRRGLPAPVATAPSA